VLASDVQVPAPHSDQGQGPDNEVRFTLTTEAGLNDGLAMPFVLAALALAAPGELSVSWGLTEVLVPLVLGLAIGWACGKLLGWLMFRVGHERVRLGEYSDGLVVLVIAFLPFALGEVVGGYGFLAVFVAAVVVLAAVTTSAQTPEELARRRLESGRAFLTARNYVEALKDFEAVLQSYPTTAAADDALLEIATYQLQVARDLDAADTRIKQLLKVYPTSSSAAMALVLEGRVALARGRTPEIVNAVPSVMPPLEYLWIPR
jgi:tetratricopeptide (TPR) repeat protein